MAENRQSCPGVRDGVPGDPRDTVKVELLETQSPEGATLTPAGKTPETGAGPCDVIARGAPQSSGVQERCPVRAFKETDGTPKSWHFCCFRGSVRGRCAGCGAAAQ